MTTTDAHDLVSASPVPPPSSTATLSPEDVAAELGTSPWWVREQARRGRVPHLRLGKGRIRFSPSQVAALVELATVDAGRALQAPAPGLDASILGAAGRSFARACMPQMSPAGTTGAHGFR